MLSTSRLSFLQARQQKNNHTNNKAWGISNASGHFYAPGKELYSVFRLLVSSKDLGVGKDERSYALGFVLNNWL